MTDCDSMVFGPRLSFEADAQVTTLLTRHDKALAEGLVTEQQLQQLQQQVSNQGSVLRSAKEAAKADTSQQSIHQVTHQLCRDSAVVAVALGCKCQPILQCIKWLLAAANTRHLPQDAAKILSSYSAGHCHCSICAALLLEQHQSLGVACSYSRISTSCCSSTELCTSALLSSPHKRLWLDLSLLYAIFGCCGSHMPAYHLLD